MKSQVQQLKIAAVISILSVFYLCAFPQTDNNVMLNALMVNLYAGINNKIVAGARLDYLSGSACNTPLSQSNSFSALYATNHKF